MRRCTVGSLIVAGGVLAAAVPSAEQQQQKPLGRFEQMISATGQQLTCAATYGSGWETCGGRDSRLCYNPSLGQSCCEVDNSHCGKGTWCAPVAGYCCLDSEDLEACARNAGFELPGHETPAELRRDSTQVSISSRTQPESSSGATAATLSNKNPRNPIPANERSKSTAPRVEQVQSSTARKEQWALGWMGMGIGTVGLLMFC